MLCPMTRVTKSYAVIQIPALFRMLTERQNMMSVKLDILRAAALTRCTSGIYVACCDVI